MGNMGGKCMGNMGKFRGRVAWLVIEIKAMVIPAATFVMHRMC